MVSSSSLGTASTLVLKLLLIREKNSITSGESKSSGKSILIVFSTPDCPSFWYLTSLKIAPMLGVAIPPGAINATLPVLFGYSEANLSATQPPRERPTKEGFSKPRVSST